MTPNPDQQSGQAPSVASLAPATGSALPFGFRYLQCTNCDTILAALDTLELGKMRWCNTCQLKTEWTYAPNRYSTANCGAK